MTRILLRPLGVEACVVFRWPDEDPDGPEPGWLGSGIFAARSTRGRQRQTRIRLPLRGKLTRLTRSPPLPLVLAMACGLGSTAWALQHYGSGLSLSLTQLITTGPANGLATPAVANPTPQWGDPLPSARQVAPAAGSGVAGPSLPPATPRRQAGTVVLASQYFGIAPYEPTPAERGNLIAVLTAPAAPDPVVARPSVAADKTPSASHLAQFSEWMGLDEALPLGSSATLAAGSEAPLTLPLAIELGRLQQQRQLEQRASQRVAAGSRTTATAARRQVVEQSDAGLQAAEAFLDAVEARMHHALASRHERQINRVVLQARALWLKEAQPDARQGQVAERALRQVRSRLDDAESIQRQQLRKLTPLIGQLPPALSWGSASELDLPGSAREAWVSAEVEARSGIASRNSAALMEAFARHETVSRRMDSVRQVLMSHARIAGALHAQMLQGQRTLPEVIQAYEQLHSSRMAVAALALEELQSQLHVAQATGRLNKPMTASAEQQNQREQWAGISPPRQR